MNPKAILFDLDDTIISFDGVAEKAWEETCCSFVKAMNTPFANTVLLDGIRKIRNWYWGDAERHRIGRMDMIKARREIVKMALDELQYFNEAAAYSLADNYTARQKELIHLFPDSISTLDRLKNLGVKLVLITNGNSEGQREKINRFSLDKYFEFCLIEEELGYGKPDKRVFECALERLGLKAEEVWMVGDNLVWDIEAPQKLGIFSIWNDYRKKGLPENTAIIPDRIINSIEQLLELIKMQSMSVRKMTMEDIGKVIEIVNRNYDEVMIEKHTEEVLQKFRAHNSADDWKAQMSWKDVFVLEKDGEIIGTGAIANVGDDSSPKYSISNFFIKPGLQGKGFGSFLFKHMHQAVIGKEIRQLHVPSSRTGQVFYRKLGFIEDELQPDKEDEIIWMTLKISV